MFGTECAEAREQWFRFPLRVEQAAERDEVRFRVGPVVPGDGSHARHDGEVQLLRAAHS